MFLCINLLLIFCFVFLDVYGTFAAKCVELFVVLVVVNVVCCCCCSCICCIGGGDNGSYISIDVM